MTTNNYSDFTIFYRPIGYLHTPYNENTSVPYQPVEENTGVDSHDFYIEMEQKFEPALAQLNRFKYIYVLFHIHRICNAPSMTASPPWAGNVNVGLFATRTPNRPNPIGLSIVRIINIENTRIYTSGLDAFNGTPVLDIKPYILDLDSKPDADNGWVDDLPDRDHLSLHLKGIPHDH